MAKITFLYYVKIPGYWKGKRWIKPQVITKQLTQDQASALRNTGCTVWRAQ